MNVMYSKICLFFGCILWLISYYPAISFTTVLATLLSITVSSTLHRLNPDHKKISLCKKNAVFLCITILYYLLCFWNPLFCAFLPLILFDLLCLKTPVVFLAGLLPGLVCIDTQNPYFLLTHLLLTVFSILLYSFLSQLLAMQERFIQIQDDSTEHSIQLQQKNRELMDKHDYEIHLATLNERNRIAREIHDNVGHMLSRSLLQIGALLAINKSETLSVPLHSLKDTLANAMNSIRDSVHNLHDDSINLETASQKLLQDFADYTVTFEYDMGNYIPSEIKYCFLSILKEGLCNITKHSNADSVHIVLCEHPGLYQLLLSDNGTNIAIAKKGIGLENMRERIESLDGNFRIATENGFRIFSSIPKEMN